MQLVSNIAGTFVASQRVDARVTAAMVDDRAFIKLLHERRREPGLLDGTVGLEDDEQLVGGRPSDIEI